MEMKKETVIAGLDTHIKNHTLGKKISKQTPNICKCQEKLFLLKCQESQSPFNKVNQNEIWG